MALGNSNKGAGRRAELSRRTSAGASLLGGNFLKGLNPDLDHVGLLERELAGGEMLPQCHQKPLL